VRYSQVGLLGVLVCSSYALLNFWMTLLDDGNLIFDWIIYDNRVDRSTTMWYFCINDFTIHHFGIMKQR